MGPIEKTLLKIENNRLVKPISEEDKISPRVQLFLDACKRIITILKDDDLFEREREEHL